MKLKFPDGTVTPLAIGVPGDREVDMKRLEAQVSPAEIEPFSEDDFAKNPHLAKGYIGPGSLGEGQPAGIRFLVDPRIVDGTRWISGCPPPRVTARGVAKRSMSGVSSKAAISPTWSMSPAGSWRSGTTTHSRHW